MENNFFSLSRFAKVAKKDFMENYKTNALRIIMLYSVITVILLWAGFLRYNNGQEDSSINYPMSLVLAPIFALLLDGTLFLYASFMMDGMKTKTKRISFLMNPATTFEKYIYRWIMATILFFAIYLVVFMLADYTRVIIYSIAYPDLYIEPFSILKSKEVIMDGNVFFFLSSTFAVQSFFVLGSTIWHKNAFIKTVAAVTVIAIVYSLTAAGLGKWLLDGLSFPMLNSISPSDIRAMAIIAMSCVAVFNWVLSYFRFKESEIIHRY